MRFHALQVILVCNVLIQRVAADAILADLTSLLQLTKHTLSHTRNATLDASSKPRLQLADVSRTGTGGRLHRALALASMKMKRIPWHTLSIKPGSISPGDRLNCAIGTVSAPYVYTNPHERASVNIHPTGPCSNPALCAEGDPYVLMEKASLTRVGSSVNIALDKDGSGTWLPFMQNHASVAWASPGDKWMGVGPLTKPCKVAVFKNIIDNPNDWVSRWSKTTMLSQWMQAKHEAEAYERAGKTFDAKGARARVDKISKEIQILGMNRSMSVGILIAPLDATAQALEEYAEFSGEVSPLHEAQIIPVNKLDYIPYQADPGPQNNTLATFVFADLEKMFDPNSFSPYLLHRIDTHHRDQAFGSGEVFGSKLV